MPLFVEGFIDTSFGQSRNTSTLSYPFIMWLRVLFLRVDPRTHLKPIGRMRASNFLTIIILTTILSPYLPLPLVPLATAGVNHGRDILPNLVVVHPS